MNYYDFLTRVKQDHKLKGYCLYAKIFLSAIINFFTYPNPNNLFVRPFSHFEYDNLFTNQIILQDIGNLIKKVM